MTAKHVVAGADAESLRVPVNFDGAGAVEAVDWARVREIKQPVVQNEEDTDQFDFVALVPNYKARLGSDVLAFSVETIATMRNVKPKALFGIGGYPRGAADVDYARRRISTTCLMSLGKYVGAGSGAAVHTLELDTNHVGGPDGVSGSPVVRVTLSVERLTGRQGWFRRFGCPRECYARALD